MFLTVFAQTIVVSLILIATLFLVKQNHRPYFALLFIAAYLVSRIVVRLPFALDLHLGLIHSWLGHFLMIGWVLIFLWIGPLRAKDIGLTLKQHSGTITPAIMVTIGIIAFKGIVAALFTEGQPNDVILETLLFQITMPPLAQELVQTGLLLTLMILALGGTINQKTDWDRVTFLAVIVTAFSHGIIFALSYNGGLQFNIMAFMIPFIGKIAYAWLRLYTGSLLFPILAFSISNFVVWLVPYLLN